MDYVIGIDPGISGGVGVVTKDGDVVEVRPMPLVKKGRADGKDTINVRKLAEFFAAYGAVSRTRVFLEKPGIRPGQSAQSNLTVGWNYGRVDAALVLSGLPHEYVDPRKWWKALGLSPMPKASTAEKKAATRAFAERVFCSPLIDGLRPTQDGLWEAALIALYGARHA